MSEDAGRQHPGDGSPMHSLKFEGRDVAARTLSLQKDPAFFGRERGRSHQEKIEDTARHKDSASDPMAPVRLPLEKQRRRADRQMKCGQRMHKHRSAEHDPEKERAAGEKKMQPEERCEKYDFEMRQRRHIQPDSAHKGGLLMACPPSDNNKQPKTISEPSRDQVERDNDQNLRSNI